MASLDNKWLFSELSGLSSASSPISFGLSLSMGASSVVTRACVARHQNNVALGYAISDEVASAEATPQA